MKNNTTIDHSSMSDQARLEKLEREVELLLKLLHPLFGSKRQPKTSKQQQLVSKHLEKLIAKHASRLNSGVKNK
jgi:hypothetical protein